MSAAAETRMAGKITPWVKCPICDDYICNVHNDPGIHSQETHVADCDCPPIDVWADYELYPYGPCDGHLVEAMLTEVAEVDYDNG